MLPSIPSITLRPLRTCAPLRTLATHASTLPSTSQAPATVQLKPQTPEGALRPHLNVPVDPNHGLWAFFRKVTKKGVTTHESVEPMRHMFGPVSGRSWKADELRRKSFKDLHTLWYVLLREQNLLATQKEEARRLGASMQFFPTSRKKYQCRKSMARIKVVLNERRLAYEGALKICAEQGEAERAGEASAKVAAERKERVEAEAKRKAQAKAERKVRETPAAVKLAEQGLFESVQQPMKS